MKYIKLRSNQDGLVAIVVTLLFLSIITLIVVSFAFLMRREQQQVLDRQLSTQAFYAAESGVSDAIYKLDNGEITQDIEECGDSREEFSEDDRMLNDIEGVIEYTCVLIEHEPTDLEYDSIGTDHSQTIRLTAPEVINKIRISWQAAESPDDGFATNDQYNLPTRGFNESRPYKGDEECSDDEGRASFANSTGILRAMLIPDGDNRDYLINNTRTFFLYPNCIEQADGDINSESTRGNGRLMDGNCNTQNTPRHCNLELKFIADGDVRAEQFLKNTVYLNLKSIYRNSSVTITAYSEDNEELPISAQQAVVDATGRANDVLRRIQVRVPLRQTHDKFAPEYVLESMDDICKRLLTRPGTTRFGGCDNPTN